MKRLVFINRYFYPDHSATSQMLSSLAFHLASLGHDVHVITSRQRYDDASALLPKFDIIDGVTVHRVAATRFGRRNLLGRGIDYASFYGGAWHVLRQVIRDGDVVIAKTDPPLISALAAHVGRHRSVRLVNWLQDIYPDLAQHLGVPMLAGPAGRILSRLARWSWRQATINVAIGDCMASYLGRDGIPPHQIRIIPNWADDAALQPLAHADNPLRDEWNLNRRLTIAYSGNLGRAHDYETVLGAAKLLDPSADVSFVMIGGGHQFETLRQEARRANLDRLFVFVPYQPQERLRQSLAAADVHWTSLRPELEGLIVPSKLYGIAAAARPILHIGAPDGEIGRLVTEHQCGWVIEQGNSAALASLVAQLVAHPDQAVAAGQRAREMLDAQFTRSHAFARWSLLIGDLTDERPA